MKAIEKEVIKSSDNIDLVIHHFETEEEPKKVLLIVHGHGEHAMRYRGLAEFFTSHQVAVSALTLRGHGESKGKRGHTPSLSQLILDVEYFIREVRLKYMDSDFFLYGHSMGGNIILNYLLRDKSSEIKGGIATSPWIKLAFDPPKWKEVIGNAVAEIIPGLTQPSGLDTKQISSIPEEVQKYEQDELVHSKISAKLFKDIQQGGENILATSDKFNHPIFLSHGQQDQITSFETSKSLGESVELIEWHAYPNSRHEVHHDVDANDLLNDILVFVNNHE